MGFEKRENDAMHGTVYDPDNIFAKILRGEAPCHRVYEDDATFVFMDIMPRVEGHALVIPKAPARNLLDADPESLARVIVTAQKVARAAKHAFDADGVTLLQCSEPAADQTVFHLHFHILPRKDGVAMRPPGMKGDQDAIAKSAEKLRAALAAMG
jgi:histidine triad (HIT) family protein